MPTDWPTYAWYTTAAILGALGLYLFIRYLIGDRSKGRRRCPKCWYDMSATPGRTCPECGRTPKREFHLFRARRRAFNLVLCAVLVIASWGALRTPGAIIHGWPVYLPTTALLVLVDPTAKAFETELFGPRTRAGGGRSGLGSSTPATPPPPTMTTELARRFTTGPMWEWQWRSITKRLIPIRSDLSTALSLHVYPSLEEPYCLGLARTFQRDPESQILAGLCGRCIIVRARTPNAKEIRLLDYGSWNRTPSFAPSHTLPPLRPDAKSITFDISLQEKPRWSKRPFMLDRATLTIASSTSPDAPTLVPTNDPLITTAVTNYTLFRLPSEPAAPGTPATILIHAQTCGDLADVAVEMTIELVQGDRIVASGRALRHRDTRCTLAWTSPDAATAVRLDDPGLMLRITGNPDVSECACRFQRAWTGTFEVPWAGLSSDLAP